MTLVDPSRRVTTPQVRERLRGILPDAALPHRVLVLPAIPLRGPGKPDRAAIRAALGATATAPGTDPSTDPATEPTTESATDAV